jgi:hypothetical protein
LLLRFQFDGNLLPCLLDPLDARVDPLAEACHRLGFQLRVPIGGRLRMFGYPGLRRSLPGVAAL